MKKRAQQEKVWGERHTIDVQQMLSKGVPVKRAREKGKREANYGKITASTSTMSEGCHDFCVNHAEESLSFFKKIQIPMNFSQFYAKFGLLLDQSLTS